MTKRINAIYKDGVFYPLKPLDLKEDIIVEIGIIKEFGSVSDFTNGDENNLYDLDEEEYLNLKKIINN